MWSLNMTLVYYAQNPIPPPPTPLKMESAGKSVATPWRRGKILFIPRGSKRSPPAPSFHQWQIPLGQQIFVFAFELHAIH